MAAEYFSNRSRSTLAATITAGATSLTIVTPPAGQDFPTSVPFRVVCNQEIMMVTARAGNAFTVTRGIEGTTAASHLAGAVIAHSLTAGMLNLLRDIEAHIIPGSAYHVAATVEALFNDIYAFQFALAANVTTGFGFGGFGTGGYGR
jgi:hypothetical protein